MVSYQFATKNMSGRMLPVHAQKTVNILQRKCACDNHTMAGGECTMCANKKQKLQRHGTNESGISEVPPIVHDVLHSPGQSLDHETRAFMEPRFGHNFSHVRIHTDAQAAKSAHSINALAYTVGHNVVFGAGQYAAGTSVGRKLLAHELSHVIQQRNQTRSAPQTKLAISSPTDTSEIEADRIADAVTRSNVGLSYQPQATSVTDTIQRTIGDGHDLSSPRFSRLVDLEEAYDNETIIRIGSSASRGVQAIQQALYDLGYRLPNFGADGKFGRETKAAVKAFQRDHPPLADDGEVGPLTMAALDARFGVTPALPPAAARSNRWDADSPAYTCVHSILCPWSPHTIDVLRTRITLKSFDSISWADEMWDGSSWVPAPFPGGGYNTGTEIGVLNSSCEEMSETLYHEVLHAEQPRTHRTTKEKESYAYRIGEEFSIAMGLGGRPSLRSTDVQGREFADPTKVEAYVAAKYPSVPAGGGGDEIIGKATTHGHVRVRRPNGTVYTRPAVIGEKVPGPMTTTNEVTHPTAGWTCP